jgi:PIN domain nuclease of toxin-antitoxin system
MSFLLDTHSWIWFAKNDRRLARKHKIYIEGAPADGILASAVSVWEIAMLVHYGRLVLAQSPRAWVENSLKSGIRILSFTAEIALESYNLPGDFHKDPADRMIVATARQKGLKLITQDKAILAYARKGHVVIAK